MPLYKHRPDIHVCAIQWDGTQDSATAVMQLIDREIRLGVDERGEFTYLTFEGHNGTQKTNIGDWIVNGVLGRCYVVEQDTFNLIYEPLDPEVGMPVEFS